MNSYTGTDVVLNAAAIAARAMEWAPESLVENVGVNPDRTEIQVLDASFRQMTSALALAAEYSDGRPVRTVLEIDPGHVVVHVWPYRATHRSERVVYEGPRAADPGQDNGRYRVWADESTCTLRLERFTPGADGLVGS